jgi:hypothetical protein
MVPLFWVNRGEREQHFSQMQTLQRQHWSLCPETPHQTWRSIWRSSTKVYLNELHLKLSSTLANSAECIQMSSYNFATLHFSHVMIQANKWINKPRKTTACHFKWVEEQARIWAEPSRGREIVLARSVIYLHITIRERLLCEVRVCNN